VEKTSKAKILIFLESMFLIVFAADYIKANKINFIFIHIWKKSIIATK